MKKIIIIFMSVLMIFASCSMDASHDDTLEKQILYCLFEHNEAKEKTNTEIVEEPKEDDSENNKTVEDEPSNEEPKEDDSENNKTVEDEPSNEENNSENEIMENKTWCDISEDTLILGLNYFVCIDNSQTKLNPSIRFESEAKTDTFFVDGYASTYVRIRVGYDNKKLNFSSVNDTYTITDVTREGSNIYITIKWK